MIFSLAPDRERWLKSFDPQEALRWFQGGFSLDEAVEWSAFFVGEPEEAKLWYSKQVPPLTAKTFKMKGVTPEEASLWFPSDIIQRSARLSQRDSLSATSWLRAKVSLDEWVFSCILNGVFYEDWIEFREDEKDRPYAEEIGSASSYNWSVSGISESMKNTFRNEGLRSAKQAKEWIDTYKANNFEVNPRNILIWHQKNFSPVEAAEWRKAISLASPNRSAEAASGLARKWRDSGGTPFDFYALHRLRGIPQISIPVSQVFLEGGRAHLKETGKLEVLKRMYDLEIPEPHIWEVEEITALENRDKEDYFNTGTSLTVEEISSWVKRGFCSPDSVLFWKWQNVSAEEAQKKSREAFLPG